MARPLINNGGDLAQIPDTEALQFPTRTINEGDTSPDPGVDGATYYSDAERKLVAWDSLAGEWKIASGSIPTSIQVEPGVDPLVVTGTVAVSSVSGEVEVKNDAGNPLTIDGTGTGGKVPVEGTLGIDDSTPIKVDLAEISTTDTLKVDIQDSTVAVTQSGAWNVGQSGSWTVAATQSGSWDVEVKNDAGNPLPVSGTVAISGTVPVDIQDSTVAVTQSGSWSVEVANDTGNPLPVEGAVTFGSAALLDSGDGHITTPAAGLPIAALVQEEGSTNFWGSPDGTMQSLVMNDKNQLYVTFNSPQNADFGSIYAAQSGDWAISPTLATYGGTLTANGDQTINVNTVQAVAFQFTGDGDGDWNPEGTTDGTNWFAVKMYAFDGSGGDTVLAPADASKGWQANVAGLSQFRMRLSGMASGTWNYVLAATSGVADDSAAAAGGGGGGSSEGVVHDNNDLSLSDDDTHQLVLDSGGNLKVNLAEYYGPPLDVNLNGALVTGTIPVSFNEPQDVNIASTTDAISITADNPIEITASTPLAVGITDGTDAAQVTGAGELNVLATAQPGVDIGDVTINNASGGSAVNIQDGGNSITVDNGGTFAVQATGTVTANAGTNLNTSALALNATLTDKSQFVKLTDGTDTALVTAAGALSVDVGNSVSVNSHDITNITASISPGTGAANLGKAEDAAAGSGDTGVAMLAVRKDVPAVSSDTTGDYSTLSVDELGNLRMMGKAVVATAAITAANQAATIDTKGISTVVVDYRGTGTSTIAFEATVDDSTWFAVSGQRVDTLATVQTILRSDLATVEIPVFGWSQFRARCSAFTSSTGTLTVRGNGSSDPPYVRAAGMASNTLPTGLSSNGLPVMPWLDRSGTTIIGARATSSQPGTMTDANGGPLSMTQRGALWVQPTSLLVNSQVTPTIQAAAYTAGDQLHSSTLLNFASVTNASARPIQIVGAWLIDKASQKVWTELWLFPSTAVTLVNANANDAFSITDANLASTPPIAIIDFLAADYKDTAANSFCQGTMFGGPVNALVIPGSTSIGGVLVTRGAPTYASTSDLIVNLVVNPL